jgi:hypothetical protein
MRIDSFVVQQVAAEVVLQLVLEGDIRVSPERVSVVERELSTAMREALLCEDALRRIADRQRTLRDRGLGFLFVVRKMAALLRRSSDVEDVREADDVLVAKILSVIARPSRRKQGVAPGGFGPSGAGPAGGLPAEVRAWEVARGETPDDPDPERKERPRPAHSAGGPAWA